MAEISKYESARAFAYRVLHSSIIMMELEPGTFVTEKLLTERFQLSRTPVREALMELSREQLVEIFPQRGCYITKIDFKLIDEVNFFRHTLEKAIAEAACELAPKSDLTELWENIRLQEYYLSSAASQSNRDKLLELDNAFHGLLFALCGKQNVFTWMRSMTSHQDRLRSLQLHAFSENKDIKTVGDHRMILEAVEKGDKALASKGITKHLGRYLYTQDQLRHAYPSYFL